MKNLFISIVLFSCLSSTYAQIGIKANNTAPIASAQLEVQSTTKAFYPPRMTTAQRTTMPSPPLAGAVVYDTDLNALFSYNGSSWIPANGLTLPYIGSASVGNGGYVLDIANNTGSDGSAIVGRNATVITGAGIAGIATAASPLADVAGVTGVSNATNANGAGVKAFHAGTGAAFLGNTVNGVGAMLSSTNGFAIKSKGKLQFAGNGVGTIGANKFLKSISSSGDAEWSDLLPITNSQNSTLPIIDITNTNTGNYDAVVFKTNTTQGGSAVMGQAINSTPSNYSVGVVGQNFSTNGLGFGVLGYHAGSGIGVSGYTKDGIGVRGLSDTGYGGYFYTGSVSGIALVTGTGNVGLGRDPSLNSDERVDINGRLRIRTANSSSGVWFNNSTNSITYTDGAFYGMKLDSETGIFIGGTWKFWVNNVGNATLTGTLAQSSDRRLKKDFVLLTHSLSDIYQLKGYHYKWIEESRSKDLQTGLIAQEVQKIFPELVQTDEKGFLSVNYIGLIPHLIESVKELKDENTSLKSRLDKIDALLTNSQLSANNMINK